MEDRQVSLKQVLDAVNKLVDRFEQILRDIRETNEDESVCGLCEYDGAFIGQSGDWCNECPGFDKADCFKLSDERRKKWLKELALPSAQPEPLTVTRDHLLTKDEYDRLKQAMRDSPILLFPPAQPVRKKGKWTKENACEFCGFQPWFERDIHTLSFCPNCGADLREEGGTDG